jgi:hypothetical protein
VSPLDLRAPGFGCYLSGAIGTDDGPATRIDVDRANQVGLEIPKAEGFVAQSEAAPPA